MPRLLHTGQIIIDLVMALDTLPPSGGDALASSASFHAGGGFNVMAAARRNGLPALYLGRHGQGRFGELARQAMRDEGITPTLPPDPHTDTGLCVALTEASAERTFISYIGAEGVLSTDDLQQVQVAHDDYVYVSGYSLLQAGKAQPLLDWLLALPGDVHISLDPGPLLNDIAPHLLDALLPRLNLWTSNRHEAQALTGTYTLEDALTALDARLPRTCLNVVRDGARGCRVSDTHGHHRIAGFKVHALDSNGAGDAHTGVLLAALAHSATPVEAARRANAGAAIAVTRRGPATAPRAEEIDGFMAQQNARTSEA